MKKFCLTSTTLFVSSVLLFASVNAQQINNFSITQCINYANKNSVTVKNALIDVQIQNQTNKQVLAAAMPQVNATVSLNDYLAIPTSLIPAQFFGGPAGTFEPVQFGTKYNSSIGISAQQILFDGQVFVGLQARDAVLSLYKKTAEVTQEQIKANIYKIYYQLVVGKKQIVSLDANIDRFYKLLHETKEIYKNGFAEKLDVDKVTVQLNNIKVEKIKAENMIAAGNSSLKFLMGMPQKDQLVLTDTLSEEELKANILDATYNYTDRKEMQLLTISQKLGEYNIRRYQLSKIPTISLIGNYSKNAQRSTFDIFGKGDWFTTALIGLNINIPIFDGGSRNAHIQQSKYELQKTNNSIQQFKQSVEYDVEQAKIKTTSALLTLDNQKQNIILAEKVYNSTKLKYEQGLGSNTEIYNAQADLKVAQSNYYNSLYDAINAKIDWLKATGKL